MVPAEIIFKKGERYFKGPINLISIQTSLKDRSIVKPIFGYNPDGIKLEDINKIQLLFKEHKLPFDEIKISKTVPFAPFLFLGTLLTYFAKGYFIYFFV
jgi:hypothetical protein